MVDIVKVSKVINAPKKFVYEWCTDFSSEDPKMTGSGNVRRIIEKTRKKAVYVNTYEGEDGKPKMNVNIVALKPSSFWHLDQFGEEDNETGDYKLTRLGKNKTRLDMVFKESWKDIAQIPSIDEQSAGIHRVWDKYISVLEKEYRDSAH
jgi:hypothetical protein